MGQSTDGVLAYGVDLGEANQDWPWYCEEDDDAGPDAFDKWYAEQLGIKLDQYDDADKLPLCLDMHCSFDYPMYILAIRSTCMSANRGSAEPVGREHLAKADPEPIRSFLKQHKVKLETKQEPSWLLASLWG